MSEDHTRQEKPITSSEKRTLWRMIGSLLRPGLSDPTGVQEHQIPRRILRDQTEAEAAQSPLTEEDRAHQYKMQRLHQRGEITLTAIAILPSIFRSIAVIAFLATAYLDPFKIYASDLFEKDPPQDAAQNALHESDPTIMTTLGAPEVTQSLIYFGGGSLLFDPLALAPFEPNASIIGSADMKSEADVWANIDAQSHLDLGTSPPLPNTNVQSPTAPDETHSKPLTLGDHINEVGPQAYGNSTWDFVPTETDMIGAVGPLSAISHHCFVDIETPFQIRASGSDLRQHHKITVHNAFESFFKIAFEEIHIHQIERNGPLFWDGSGFLAKQSDGSPHPLTGYGADISFNSEINAHRSGHLDLVLDPLLVIAFTEAGFAWDGVSGTFVISTKVLDQIKDRQDPTTGCAPQ